MNTNISCCENKVYLTQIIQSIAGRTREETEVKLTLFNLFAIGLLSLMEQNKKNCEKCSGFLNEIIKESLEIGRCNDERSHDE